MTDPGAGIATGVTLGRNEMKAMATLFIMALAVSAFSSTPPKLVIVTIATEQNGTRYRINGREVPINDIQQLLGRLAELDKSQTLLIEADDNTTIKTLTYFIALCKIKGFSSIRVFNYTDTGQAMELIVGNTSDTITLADEENTNQESTVTLPAPFLFNVGCTSEPPAIVPARDRRQNTTNNFTRKDPDAEHRAPAEIAPMTEPERNYYKDNAKGKLLLDVPK